MPTPRPAALGTICCALAAVFYSTSSACMRQVSALNCDPCWAVCLKESLTVIVIGPWLVYRLVRGRPILPPAKILFILILAGLADQLLGNLGWQWSLGILGLAITVPTAFGAMITSSAIFGRLILRETVSARSMAAIGLLIVSLLLLSLGARSAGNTTSQSVSASMIETTQPQRAQLDASLAVEAMLVAGVAGVAYALLSIAIRHTMNGETQQSTLMFIITGIGVITLGPLSIHHQGIHGLLYTPGSHIAWLAAAGIFNLLGFVFLIKGLQLTTVVHANALNASQVAMGALAGIFIFQEQPNYWLLLGISLTVLGIFLVDRPVAEEAIDRAI